MRLLMILIASLAMSAAHAQSGNNADAKAINNSFATLDKNADGGLTKAEVSSDKEIVKRFAKFDANKDGKFRHPDPLGTMVGTSDETEDHFPAGFGVTECLGCQV